MSTNTSGLVPQYTSPVTKQYKQATKGRTVRYTIRENFTRYPALQDEFNQWRAKQATKGVYNLASFTDIFHEEYMPSMFDIRNAEIREDWGQRNCLTERGRMAKVLGMAKYFDPKLFEPISIDYIADMGIYIIRDGGGRSHAAYLNGIHQVPATVRYVDSYEESRRLFMDQDKFNAAISSYDKFLQRLNDPKHNYHKMSSDTWNIAKSSGFCLHYSNKSASTPLIEGISVLQRTIRKVGGDAKNVKWGNKTAPNIAIAVDIIKHAFKDIDEIPVSVLEGLTAYVHVSKNRIPSGDAGINRLKQFAVDIRDSSDQLSDIRNWTQELKFDSSNHYAEYGATAFMRKWNELYSSKRAKKGVYSWVTWEAFEMDIISKNILVFARDESLLP
jgi:hypothetical protein